MHPHTQHLGGRLLLTKREVEIRMSHWVRSPVLIDARSDEILVDLSGTHWDLVDVSETADSLCLVLRRYPDGGRVLLSVRMDPPGLCVGGHPVKSAALLQAVDQVSRGNAEKSTSPEGNRARERIETATSDPK